MDKSDQIGKLAKALSIVQGKLLPAHKDAKNPFFKSNYATLGSVWDSCRALLSESGLSVAQIQGSNEQGDPTLTTILMHESDQWISDTAILPVTKNDAQGVGSCLTYFRRYGLASMIGIIADEDDDGNAAVRSTTAKQPDVRSRIANAQKEIKALGGTVEAQVKGETDQQYFEMLIEQYNRLKK